MNAVVTAVLVLAVAYAAAGATALTIHAARNRGTRNA